MNRKFKLLKKIELSESIEVWSIFKVRDDKVIVDWCWSMSAEWFIKHWYIEEIKKPTHFGNGMSEVENRVLNWVWYIDEEAYFTKCRIDHMIAKIWKWHSENDGNFWNYYIFYSQFYSQRRQNSSTAVYTFVLPNFSSEEKAQACIDHFWSELDILLSWYNMQNNNK